MACLLYISKFFHDNNNNNISIKYSFLTGLFFILLPFFLDRLFIHTFVYSCIDLFELISGCELFIGNQSFPYSLAEGIKKPAIQETDFEGVPNCVFERDNAYFTTSKESSSIMKIRPIIEEIV